MSGLAKRGPSGENVGVAETRTADGARADGDVLPGVLFLALFVGVWLRWDQLLVQIPADDEWHALRVVKHEDWWSIFTHFGVSDYSIPLALYYELLSNTIGIDELGLRLPMLVAGLASLVVLPKLVQPLVGARAAYGFSLLMAVSPILVYFSRYARPYMPATLAAFTALVAAWRWREEGGRGWAVTYAVCAVLAAWMLPVYGPLVLAPWVWLFGESLIRRSRAPHAPGSVLALGVGIGVVLAALLGPALVNDLGSLTGKMSEGRTINPRTLRQVADLFTGSPDSLPRAAVLVAAVAGGLVMLKRAPALMGFLFFAFGLQVLSLFVANPDKVHAGNTLARYVLPMQPLILLGVAVLLGELDRLLSAGRLPATVPLLSGLAAFTLLVAGPQGDVLRRPNNFTNHAWHQYAYSAEDREGIRVYWGTHRKQHAPFYDQLAEHEPGSLSVLEAPWHYPWHRIKMREMQAIHRQHVTVGFVGMELNPQNELPLGDQFRFSSFVDVGDHEAVVARGFDYVIFHNDLTRELKKSGPLPKIPLGDHLERYTERFGAPVYEDKRLTVFAVK